MSNVKYNDDDFINLIGMRGVMSVRQIVDWMGRGTVDGVDKRLRAMASGDNPPVVGRTIARPWISSHPQSAFILTPFGADRYNEINNTNIQAPDTKTLIPNFIHSLGLIDIGFALRNMGVSFDFESRVKIDNLSDEFIRPDVAYQMPGDARKHVVELERSRGRMDLENRLLGRLFRWQKAVTNGNIHPDIIVLFSLDKGDTLMIASWLEALNAYVKTTGENPAFTVWYMNFADFTKKPTLDLRRFKQFPVSTDPVSFLLAAERDRYFAQKEAEIPSCDAAKKAIDETEIFWKLNWYQFLENQKRDHLRRVFLDTCDFLHNKVTAISQRHEDAFNGSIPWIAIKTIRFWLEQPVFKDIRIGLIDALREYKSAYGRGINTAANYLEKIVWESLLYKFDIGRDGPLSFRARLADDTTKQKNHTGIIPSFEIIAPWAGRESQEDADQSARALEWLVNMLMLYPTELGLTKENKKPQSSPALKSASQADEMPEDPFFDENFTETSPQ